MEIVNLWMCVCGSIPRPNQTEVTLEHLLDHWTENILFLHHEAIAASKDKVTYIAKAIHLLFLFLRP